MNLAALNDLLPGTPPPSDHYFRLVGADYAGQMDETAQTVLRAWR